MAELASEHCDAPVSSLDIVDKNAANWAAHGVPAHGVFMGILTVVGLCHNHRENERTHRGALLTGSGTTTSQVPWPLL